MCHKCLHHDFCHSKGFKDRATWPGVLQLAILQSPETWQEFQAIAAWAAGTLAANLARQELNSARFAQMLLSLCQRSNKKSFPTEMVHFKSLDFWMTSRGFMGFLLKSHEYHESFEQIVEIQQALPRIFLAKGRGQLHRHKKSLRQRPTPQCPRAAASVWVYLRKQHKHIKRFKAYQKTSWISEK